MANKYFSLKKCPDCNGDDWHFVMSINANPMGVEDYRHVIQCTHCHLVFEEEDL